MVTKENFAALISSCEEDIKSYMHTRENPTGAPVVTYNPEYESWEYMFQWFDSGEGCVKVFFHDAQGDQTQWDTEMTTGASDVWAPFDAALAGMWAVLQAEKLHKEKFPESYFTGEYEDGGSII